MTVRARIAAAAWLVSATAFAQDEVPFVATPDRVAVAMLEIAGVGPSDHVIDLGSGDGRIVVAAARRFGASGLGIELVPELVERSRAAARAAGVEARARFRVGDLFEADLAPATVVTMYLLPEVNLQLRPRLLRLAPGTRIVSHDWDLGDWRPDRTLVLDVPDKPLGRERVSRIHHWVVPADVAGRWCAADLRLEIGQRFQRFSAVLASPAAPAAAPPKVFDGHVDGVVLRPETASGQPDLRLDAASGRLHESSLPGRRGRVFARADAAGRCPS